MYPLTSAGNAIQSISVCLSAVIQFLGFSVCLSAHCLFPLFTEYLCYLQCFLLLLSVFAAVRVFQFVDLSLSLVLSHYCYVIFPLFVSMLLFSSLSFHVH